jgi:hypothetical protein
MSVRGVKTIWCVIDTSERDAHRVQPRNLSYVDWCDGGTLLVGCVAGHVKAGKEEIFSHHIICVLAWKSIDPHWIGGTKIPSII